MSIIPLRRHEVIKISANRRQKCGVEPSKRGTFKGIWGKNVIDFVSFWRYFLVFERFGLTEIF